MFICFQGKIIKKDGVNYINIRILGNDEYVEEERLKNMFGNFSEEESYIMFANMLERLIDISKYDLVHLNSQLFLKAFRTKKRIFTIHTNPFEFIMNFGEESFKCMIKNMQQENNDNTCYVTPSEYYKKIYEKLTKVEINFIPHAIRIDRVNKKINVDDIFNKYSINKTTKHILLPSRLEPIQKQPMIFMSAFSKIDREKKDKFQVICTGLDEQYRKYALDIQEFCEEKGIDLKILRFDYMYEAYSIADLIILPSKSESFGYSALESLSLGIPTILNSIPTYLEIVKESNNSYIFDGTEESLVCELIKVLDTTLEKKKQTREWLKRYDLNEFGKKYLEII